MKYYIFKRQSRNFEDILKDVNIKKYIDIKTQWVEHLMVGLNDNAGDKICSYIVLKYGDDITQEEDIIKSRAPILGKDYLPKNHVKLTIISSLK